MRARGSRRESQRKLRQVSHRSNDGNAAKQRAEDFCSEEVSLSIFQLWDKCPAAKQSKACVWPVWPISVFLSAVAALRNVPVLPSDEFQGDSRWSLLVAE